MAIPDELYADLALINGKIATIDKDDTVAEAVACKGEKIIKVGTTEEVKAYIGKHTQVIDLKGKLVTPGFVDTHAHFSSGGRRVRTVDLRYVRSMDALIEELRKKAETFPKGRWIQGWGYNESKLKEKRFPNRYDLDKASTDHPISITRQGGHDGIRVNSLALELAGISKDTPDPEPPSFIHRDPETGEPLGNLREEGAKPVLELIALEPVLTKEEMKEGLKNAIKMFLSLGITSLQEPGAPMDFLPMYQELLNEGEFHIRNSFLIAAPILGRSYHRNERYQLATDLSVEAGYMTHFGDNHLKFAGIKLGHDGSMSAGNCAVYEPYLNYPTPDNYGVVHGYTNEELNDGRALAEFAPIVVKLHKAGMRSGLGAIGDRGIDFFLDSVEAAYNEDPRPDSRHSIEHCSLPTQAALERMKRLDVTSSTSVGFGWELGDQHRGFMGMERMKRYMPMKSFKEMGIVASGNADWPVCSANIMEGIHVCVNRTSETGQDLGQSQAISVMDAIRVYTWNGAYITFEEDIKGSIEHGKLADFAVLDTDILTCDPADIVKTKVLTTIVDGKVVYQME
ncbi:MAG: amidohydrolase [Candidatus Bathyarchaeota archaeon]|nr:amidohydrolase [Candidatus Bathyarchaeota archaeon]